MLGIQDFYVSLEDPVLNYNQQIFGFFFKIRFIAHFPKDSFQYASIALTN